MDRRIILVGNLHIRACTRAQRGYLPPRNEVRQVKIDTNRKREKILYDYALFLRTG